MATTDKSKDTGQTSPEQKAPAASTINPRPRAWAMKWDGAALQASSGTKSSGANTSESKSKK